jgi:2-amino-4,5-dihydroxy-6-oxo-7-(phosphooxy)heptanoate synthase
VSDALRGGAAGVAMGRNVFQADQPGWMAVTVARLVHESLHVPDVPDRYDVDNQLALTS